MEGIVNDRKEINEAIAAGEQALNSLYAAQEKLDSAKGCDDFALYERNYLLTKLFFKHDFRW